MLPDASTVGWVMKLLVTSLILATGLMGAGCFLFYRVTKIPIDERFADLNQPRHLITSQMEIETSALKNVKEPQMTVISENGKIIKVASPMAARPEFLLFIKTDCPCSIDAQPLFNLLANKFSKKVEFFGVIDSDQAGAKAFASQFSAAFPVLADKNLKLIHAYQAKGGIYCALIARNGHLVKMWPGYSADLLQEMNRLLSESAGVSVTHFDPQYAPKQKAAGCAYAADYAG